MPKTYLGLLTAVVLFIVPATAGAAGPATVRVHVEGGEAMQLAPTIVTTNANTVNKDGNPAHNCTGTSATGALELATAGNWGYNWFNGLGYAVNRIGLDDFSTSNYAYWAFAVNEIYSNTGLCDTELSNGDRLLFYKSCFGAPDDGKTCPDDQILHIVAAARSLPGTTSVKVELVDAFAGTRSAASGVTLRSGAQTVVTNGSGEADLSFAAAGRYPIRATQGAHVPDQTEVCVAPAGDNGLCGAPDKSPPTATIAIKDGKKYKNKGPRSLKGTVNDAAGISKVQLRLTARANKRSRKCTTFDAKKGKFVKQKRCGAMRGKAFAIDVKGGEWSYLLPDAPGKGRYVLDVVVTDTSGNGTLERVVFYVK